MIKQSRCGQAAGVGIILALISVVFIMLYEGNIGWETLTEPLAQLNPPPLAVRVYTPFDCVVEVSNYLPDGQRSYGQGVTINYEGVTFVLTSSMIFTQPGECRIYVDGNSYSTEIIEQNDVWGLVALECPPFMVGEMFTKVNEYPNHPPGDQVLVGPWGEVNTLEYINNDWVLLDGSLPATATGMPSENDGGLVGIIVGLNRVNEKQSIMVGNRAIQEFCKQVSMLDAPQVLEVEQ